MKVLCFALVFCGILMFQDLEAKTVVFDFPQWETNTWVFLPACAYNGNRDFVGIDLDYYPPGPSAAGYGAEPRREILSTIPKLNPDGSGEIEVTSGDMSVPCAGFWFPTAKTGVLIFTEAQYKGENIGYTVKAGRLTIDYPAQRKSGYRFARPRCDNPDKASVCAPESYQPRVRRLDFAAADVSAFIERFFRERKCLMSSPHAEARYSKALWNVIERCWNEKCFIDGAYCQERVKWVPGWSAGPQCVYPLYRFGGELTKRRCRETLDFMCEHQTATGVFYGCCVGPGASRPAPALRQAGDELTQFFRMHCDGLWNLMRCLETMGSEPKWKSAAEKGADALVKAWCKNGQFGQWVDPNTLDLIVGRSDACAIAPAALVEAWKMFGKSEYLMVAKTACEDYCVRDLDKGILYGAAADEVMAPDAEVALPLLESCMALYEVTNDDKWIAWGRKCAALHSTWVMTYAYEFPVGSQLALHGVNSTGSVFANVQNKHSAPGYATMSGRGLLKLYRVTGDRDYLELLRDTVFFLPQAVSLPDNPYVASDGRQLDPGFMCERVNTSDWEGKENIGGSIFYASCWCGSSLLATWADLIVEPEFADAISGEPVRASGGR